MERTDYIEKLLEEYSKSFDIDRDFEIGGIKPYAYGYFSTVSEKYVLSPKANLWSIHGFEHILFIEKESITFSDIEEASRLMQEHMAPELVCKGNKFPEKDHMYSYVTVAFICSETPDEETVKALRKFKYEKNYLFTIRGHVEGHMILADLKNEKVYTNKAAKHLSDFYMNAFSKTAVK